jgi:hypothetical protein
MSLAEILIIPAWIALAVGLYLIVAAFAGGTHASPDTD